MGRPAWNPAIPSTLPTQPWESYLFSLCSSLLSIPIKFSTNMDANGLSVETHAHNRSPHLPLS